MRTVGLFEAKQKLSELVERASEGEQIGITRRGKLAAIIMPAREKNSIQDAFSAIDEIRSRLKPLPKGMSVKDLIEEGRR
jgi:prevent-host-death family protein